MKELPSPRLLPVLGFCALIALVIGACDDCCDDDDDDDYGGSIPVYFEVEPNNTAATANYFGTLSPGDEFIIEGFITDNGTDPFDGFEFTSNGQIHVDYQLFINDGAADLDICLYDPVLDMTISCDETTNNPEQGGIDITNGNVDFQLVVNSFSGQSGYCLEIFVVQLAPMPPAALELEASDEAPEPNLIAHHPRDYVPRDDADGASFDAYANTDQPTGVKTVAVSRFDVDTELGVVIETTTIEVVPILSPAAEAGQSVKVR